MDHSVRYRFGARFVLRWSSHCHLNYDVVYPVVSGIFPAFPAGSTVPNFANGSKRNVQSYITPLAYFFPKFILHFCGLAIFIQESIFPELFIAKTMLARRSDSGAKNPIYFSDDKCVWPTWQTVFNFVRHHSTKFEFSSRDNDKRAMYIR